MNTGQNCYYFGFSDIFYKFMLVLLKLYGIIFICYYPVLAKYMYFVYFHISQRFLSVISSSIQFHVAAFITYAAPISDTNLIY